MSFASGLPATLKQEPQTDQLKINKSSLNIHQDPSALGIATKNDKPLTPSAVAQSAGHIDQNSAEKLNKNDVIDNHCILEQNSNANKTNNLNSEQGKCE